MEQFLGKRVSFKTQSRDNYGKLTNDMIEVVGKCTFIGNNKFLGHLQITIDRTPFEVKHITHIKCL